MDTGLIATIITALIAVLGMIGGLWAKISKVINAISQSFDVFSAIDDAIKSLDNILADKVVTADEIAQEKEKIDAVKKELEEAKTAWKGILSK